MNQVKIPVKISTPQFSKPFVLKHFRLEARVGIERFMLCFPREFSHQTSDSQGYSVTTRLNPILLVHYSATEESTEGVILSCLRNTSRKWPPRRTR
jgi:hypothetical protein